MPNRFLNYGAVNRWAMIPKKALVLAFLIILGVLVSWPRIRAKISGNQLVTINNITVPPIPTLNAERVISGEALYTAHCAACHGIDLTGAPDWKEPLADGSFPPPPQDSTGHSWHHPDSLLLDIVAGGGDPAFNSKMPAFEGKLSPDEIRSILEYIKGFWGPAEREFQWWITASAGAEE